MLFNIAIKTRENEGYRVDIHVRFTLISHSLKSGQFSITFLLIRSEYAIEIRSYIIECEDISDEICYVYGQNEMYFASVIHIWV
jgi:hypothetical protein